MGLTPIPQNYKRNVDWIIGAYEDAGVDFPNGFQKDAIQMLQEQDGLIIGRIGNAISRILKTIKENLLLYQIVGQWG